MTSFATRKEMVLENPRIVQTLLNDPRSAWLWLPLRVWLGWKWLDAALHKIDNPAWVQTGEALQGFWTRAIAIPETGRPAIAFDWYREFIRSLLDAQAYTWFGKLVAYGELLVGIALIIGAFTGIAVFFSGLMNWNFMMAGTASTNPMLFLVAVGLIMAWKVSGYIGLDYFLLPWIGTPWRRKSERSSEKEAVVLANTGD